MIRVKQSKKDRKITCIEISPVMCVERELPLVYLSLENDLLPLIPYSHIDTHIHVRDWSLIKGGGPQNGRGGGQVLPYKKVGRKFSHAEGGHKKFCGSVYA